MWIGFSIWDQVNKLFDILLVRRKYAIKNIWINTLRCIKLITLSVCQILLSIQTISSFKEYFSYEYLIRTSSQFFLTLPTFGHWISTSSDANLILQFNTINAGGRKKRLITRFMD